MSGSFPFKLAIAQPAPKAVAIHYGSLATDKTAVAQIQASMARQIRRPGPWNSPGGRPAFETTMKELENN